MKEEKGWQGDYFIEVKYKDKTIEKVHIKNKITNNGLKLLRDLIAGDVQDAELKYLAVGSGAGTTTDDQATLNNETFRTGFISSFKLDFQTLQKTAILQQDEAVGQIEEIGVFAGAGATTTRNSGVLISRVPYSRDKSDLESIQIVRQDKFVRGESDVGEL